MTDTQAPGHYLRFYAEGEDIGYTIVCTYPPDDPARLCVIPDCACPELEDGVHFAGDGCTGETRPGCNVQEWLEAAGYEAIAVPTEVSATVPVTLTWDDGPVLEPS